jgi:NADH-quinone oxidoreductase subunit J
MFANILFLGSAIITVGCAIAVLAVRDLMHACVYLLGTLIGIAGLYATLGADFVAVTQIMVYVGGVVILMLFAVMLTGGKDFVSKAQKLLNLIPSMGNWWSYSIAVVTALVFLLTQIYLISNLLPALKLKEIANDKFTETVETLGELLVTDHILAFEFSSVLLLGALVGAAIIARPRKNTVGLVEEKKDVHHD